MPLRLASAPRQRTVEIREGGATDPVIGGGTATLALTEAGTFSITGLPDLTFGQSYTLVASCETVLAENDALTGTVDANAFTVPTNLDFPVSVPTSIEGRYQTANLPASVTLTKSRGRGDFRLHRRFNNNPVHHLCLAFHRRCSGLECDPFVRRC